jgi:hypothetical protein
MSFKISTSPKFWSDVELRMVGEDGKELKGKIKVQFSRLDKEGFDDYLARNRDEKFEKSLLEVVHDWKGAEDDDGAVTYTPENFKRWCDHVPGSYLAIARKFAKVHNGLDNLEELRSGN